MFSTHHVKALTAETAWERIVRTCRKKLKISVLYFTSLCIQTLPLTFKQQGLFSYISTHLLPEYTHLNAHSEQKFQTLCLKMQTHTVISNRKEPFSKAPCLSWIGKTGRYAGEEKGKHFETPARMHCCSLLHREGDTHSTEETRRDETRWDEIFVFTNIINN